MCRRVRGVFQSVHGRSDVPSRGGGQTCRCSAHIDVVSQPSAQSAETAAEVRCSVYDWNPRRCFVESKTLLSAVFGITTFLEFLETWKCRGILNRSGKSHIVRERLDNLCSQGYLKWHNACDVHGHVLRTWYNLPVLYSYFNTFCICDVQHFELTLVSCWNTPQSS